MMKKKKEQNLVQPQKYTVTTFVLQIVMGLVGLLFLVPIIMIVSYSFKTKQELYLSNPLSLPKGFYLENSVNAFDKLNMPTSFLNTGRYRTRGYWPPVPGCRWRLPGPPARPPRGPCR